VECVAYGVGSPFVEELLEIVRRLGWGVRGGVANIETDYWPIDLEPIVSEDGIPADWLSLPAVLPMVTPGFRWQVEHEAIQQGFRAFATAVDPTASVASTSSLGEGTIICAGALVGARAGLGRLACVNKGAIVGHHDELADYVTLGPGATLCGNVSVGTGHSSGQVRSSTTRSRSVRTPWSGPAPWSGETCPSRRSSPEIRRR
jgi:hypothetical protein